MKISAINSAYSQAKTQKINTNKRNNYTPSFKSNDDFSETAKELLKGFSLGTMIIAGGIYLAKNSGKIKDAVSGFMGKSKKKATITIPLKPKQLQLDAEKLRKLPKDLKRQAIAELNNAVTAADKTQVIQKFRIGS